MTIKTNGGQAFPQISELGDIAATSNGMTLRDYFAAKAMQGELASQSDEYGSWDLRHYQLAQRAYLIADAMLAAREEA